MTTSLPLRVVEWFQKDAEEHRTFAERVLAHKAAFPGRDFAADALSYLYATVEMPWECEA